MIRFTEDMKLGIPHIDSQHKSMIDFANRAAFLCDTNPDKEQMRQFLDFLYNYITEHFRDEEELQIVSNYPRYQKHRDIHREFVVTFNALYEEFQKNGPSHELSLALTNSVTNWIITHIKKEDIEFGKHYSKVKRERLKKFITE